MKVVVVGGGSTYTPELVSGIAARTARLPVSELVLLDPDPSGCDVVGAFAQRILDARRLVRPAHPDRRPSAAALDGADAVLVQLRVGGQDARLHDETVPLPCGCLGQETTGAGGLAKALRTVPGRARPRRRGRRRAAAPDAWIVDFTNPVGIVTRALRDAGHRAIGPVQRGDRPAAAHAPACSVSSPTGCWSTRSGSTTSRGSASVLLDGDDVLPGLLDRPRATRCAEQLELPADAAARARARCRPTTCATSTAHDLVLARAAVRASRAPQPVQRDRGRSCSSSTAIRRWSTKPALLEQRGGAYYSEAAVGPAHLAGHRRRCRARGRRAATTGTLAGLADDDLVEVPGARRPRRARTRCRSRRSRPSCSAWSSTSRRTSGWRSGPPSW